MPEEAVRRQRRRKRRRPQERTRGSNANHNAATNKDSSAAVRRKPTATAKSLKNFEDDSSLAFLDSNGAALSDHKAMQVSLLKLLHKRQTGGNNTNNRRSNVRTWQQQTLFQFTKRPRVKPATALRHENNMSNAPPQRREWRPFVKRCIPFTQLGTPVLDAVLAPERKGSFVLSLGAQHPGSEVPLLLALRFYGVPSPSGMERQKKIAGKARGITPLLQTVPLLYNDIPSNESMEDSIFNFRRNISPASTPVSILVSNDWNIGMAMFQPSNVWREEGPVGNLVLFSLPRSRSDVRYARAFVCKNVRMGGTAFVTLRNLMWRVDKLPCLDPNQAEPFLGHFNSIIQLPGYLVLNDEEDGFRLTWVMECWNVLEKGLKTQTGGSVLENGFTPESNIISRQDTWEEICYETSSGKRVPLDPTAETPLNVTSGSTVSCEAFLHVDIMLGEILSRRKKKVSESHPQFYYNLISIAFGGRVADLVIVFLRGGGKPGSLGVFVRADLFSGTIQELDWVQGRKVVDMTSLRAWSNSLALNRRMRHVRAGPFSVNTKGHSRDWGRLCQEMAYIDYDEKDDYDYSFWTEYLANPEDKRPPKRVSLSSIYPDCDLVTNNAITSCLPVSSLQCKDSPIQLIYG
ncbi:unnamed protein product [Cylindrotheca closterium]|uniref:Uncharacterized protein n=1 Tax=Cylindrotheca closterium TaxID=2856 RepID=A0AAD2CBQ8_9STRA|nr:unnamed protein product [Cylindrotheca closterium]